MSPTSLRLDRDDARLRIMLLVSSLARGGAERQVVHLANQLDPEQFDVYLAALVPDVPLARELRQPERLYVIGKRWRFDPGVVRRAAALLRALDIQLAHGFLFDADLVARLAGRRAGVPVIVASERNSEYRRPLLQRLAQHATRGGHDALIANSEAGRRFTVRTLGVPAERVHVLHNGVDTQRFAPGPAAAARATLGLPVDAPLVGMVASFKPQKNHRLFLDVAQRVCARLPETRFVCVGDRLECPAGALRWLRAGAGLHGNTARYKAAVLDWIHAFGLERHVLVLGPRADVTPCYQACDVTVLTSVREGTPNVLLESMACGTPVVATDVADNRLVVPDAQVGFVTPPADAAAMAERICMLLENRGQREQFGRAAREWVTGRFSLAQLGARAGALYARIYKDTLARRATSRSAPRSAAPRWRFREKTA